MRSAYRNVITEENSSQINALLVVENQRKDGKPDQKIIKTLFLKNSDFIVNAKNAKMDVSNIISLTIQFITEKILTKGCMGLTYQKSYIDRSRNDCQIFQVSKVTKYTYSSSM